LACVAAGIPGVAAAALAVVTLFRDARAPRPVRWVGAATLLASSACFALYLPDVLSLGSALMAVAVLERISVVLLLSWMVTGALQRGGLPDRRRSEERAA
jgi:hypothetical protein